MIRTWIFRGTKIAFGIFGLWVALSIFGFVTGFHPRFGIEAYFQQVIREADVVDRYRGSEAGGWDSEDVTSKICDRVDASLLNRLGIQVDDRTSWPGSIGGDPKPETIWTVFQDKGLIAACSDHSTRYLDIKINRETLACSAEVSVVPNCDL